MKFGASATRVQPSSEAAEFSYGEGLVHSGPAAKLERVIQKNTLQMQDKNFTGEDQADFKSCSELYGKEEDDYETVNSSTLEPIHALRILPPKPLQESEYADKRYLMPSGITSEMSSQHPSQSPQHLAPLPPPRPLKTLPKQYQPLPPETKISSQVSHTRKTLSQAHTFPISAKFTRHISLRELNEVKMVESRAAIDRTQMSCRKGSGGAHSPEHIWNASQGAAGRQERDGHRVTNTIRDLNKYEWYIGEYDRHEAEVTLLQENTDETFLVRDCSKKSNTEPYVLVVYYGRRVYNIKVRFLEDSQQYALGTGLRGDDKFNSVKEIIDFYKYVPITLIDGKDKAGRQREQCYLTYPFKLRK
ncbi:cytokine-dependent hematopoietic cell linker [Mergus octosetaceus]